MSLKIDVSVLSTFSDFSIQNIMEENPQVITNIVTRVVDDIIGVIIPAMRQFIDESSPVQQSSSKDTQTAHHHYICHVKDTKPDDGMLLHASRVPAQMSDQSSTHYRHQPISSKTESLLGGECGPLNMDQMKKAERVIWKAIQEAMEQIKTMMSSGVDRAQSQCSSNEEHSQHLKSTSGSTHEGFCGGDSVLTNKSSISLMNPQAQRESAEQMFLSPAAKETQHEAKAQLLEPSRFFSVHNSCDTAQRNLIYGQFVEDILGRVYSLFSDESTETTSQTETISSPPSSLSSSSKMQNTSLPLLADKSNITPVCSASVGWDHCVALRNASASPKLPMGQTIRLLPARPFTSEEKEMAADAEPYADEMVMDIMEQIRYETEQQSRESKNSDTPDSIIPTEDYGMIGQGTDFPLVIKLNRQPLSPPKTQHHEAVEISHQIFLDIKRQLDEGHSSAEIDVSKTMEKAIVSEFINMALDKLSNMYNHPKYSIAKAVAMNSCLPENMESPQSKKSLKDSEMMKDAKMQFEKAACQPVKAVLENALGDFLSLRIARSKCASKESLSSRRSCSRAMSNNQIDLSSLASDIVFIVWEKLIETSGCHTSTCFSHNDTELKDLMKTISEISSLNSRTDSPTLKAELAMEGINCAVKTKVRHFVTQESNGGQRATNVDPIPKKTAMIDRSVDVMNDHSKPVNSGGQDIHNSVISTTSEHEVKYSNGHMGPPQGSKQTYTSSQTPCSLSPLISSSERDNFSGALSKSSMSQDTYGEQAISIKTKKDVNSCTSDPTFEGLVIQPHANSRDLTVQRVALEELSSAYQADNIQSERTRMLPSSKPPEVLFPSVPEQLDVVGKTDVRIHGSQISQPNEARPSPAMLYLFRPTIVKVTLKVIAKCVLGSRLITKQSVDSFERWILQNRRPQSAKPANEMEKIIHKHRMIEATQAFRSPQETLPDLTTKSVKGRRPHSAVADYRGKSVIEGCNSAISHMHEGLKLWSASHDIVLYYHSTLNCVVSQNLIS